MIKNIVFDMGGVLIDWSPELYMARYDISEEEKELVTRVVFKSYKWPLLDYGYYDTVEDFLADVEPELPENLRWVARDVTTNWYGPGVFNYKGMADIIRQLKENGYKIYLLSNAGPNHDDYWKYVAGSEYFDGKVVSAQVKQFKPCSEIYKTLLERFNLIADECVFVDDLQTNCAGAFLMGIHPVHFKNPEDMLSEFRKLGIRI